MTLYNKSMRLIKDHPYLAGGMALAMTAGLGYGGYIARATYRGRLSGGRRLGARGLVEDGMLKEAVGESPYCLPVCERWTEP